MSVQECMSSDALHASIDSMDATIRQAPKRYALRGHAVARMPRISVAVLLQALPVSPYHVKCCISTCNALLPIAAAQMASQHSYPLLHDASANTLPRLKLHACRHVDEWKACNTISPSGGFIGLNQLLHTFLESCALQQTYSGSPAPCPPVCCLPSDTERLKHLFCRSSALKRP